MHGRRFLLAIGVIGICLAPGLARAQFYDLDGAYHCVIAPDTKGCAAGGNPTPPPLPPPPPAPPSVDEIIGRIRTHTVTVADMKLLESKAVALEPRAVEALAWCRLNGIGSPADAVTAYLLYGQAAQLGIPTARANQTAIFETRLNQEQRQQVLMHDQTQ
jgi:TPR repeat protein